MKLTQLYYALSGSVLLLAQSSQATLLAYEGFDTAVANGTDVTTVGVTGSGFSGYINTNFRNDIEDGLSYTDGSANTLASTGKSGGLDVSASGTQNLQLALTSSIANSGTIYVSYLISVSGVTSFGLAVGLMDSAVSDSASPTAALEATFRSTSSNWGIYGDATGLIDDRTGPDSSPDATGAFFVVSELNMDTEVMTTWLNPTDLTDVSGSAAFTLSDTAATWDAMSHFGFSLGTGISGTVDEIRIATTLAEVTPLAIPEPATVTLILCGALLCAGRRYLPRNSSRV